MKRAQTFLACLALIAVTVVDRMAIAQTLNQNVWIADNTVFATVRSGNTIYMGGAFTYVGPATGLGSESMSLGQISRHGFSAPRSPSSIVCPAMSSPPVY